MKLVADFQPGLSTQLCIVSTLNTALCSLRGFVVLRGTSALVVPSPIVKSAAAERPAAALMGLCSYLDALTLANQFKKQVPPPPPLSSAEARPQVQATLAQASSGEMYVRDICDTSFLPITMQGSSLQTWSFTSPVVERVKMLLSKTEGHPLNADIEGPDNTPQQAMKLHVEDGSIRTFSIAIETPRGSHAVAVRNTNSLNRLVTYCIL